MLPSYTRLFQVAAWHENFLNYLSKKIAEGRRLLEKRKKKETRSFRKYPVFDAQNDGY